MSDIPCRNRLEAEFESLIVRHVSQRDVEIKIDGDAVHDQEVTIETIIDFYVRNEKEIDYEGIVRAFVTAVHFAKDDETAALSRWLNEVRPEIMKTITPKLMVSILMKKLMNLIENSETDFISKYIRWLVTSYLERNEKNGNRYVLNKFIKRINEKMFSFILKIEKSEKDFLNEKLLAAFFLKNHGYLSDLYDENR
jgi:hypothetical protein